MHHDAFEQKKREKEFEEFKRRNQEWLNRQLDQMVEFLIDLWIWDQEHEKEDEHGSSLTGSKDNKNR